MAWDMMTLILARRDPSRQGSGLPIPLGYATGPDYGSVTAPRSAPVTSRAYLASTPVV